MRKVLIVDDDAFVREVIEMSFTSAGGWQVILASSGEAGVHQARASKPDVILLDLTMPDMDGVATLGVLQEDAVTSSLPVIFLTADVQSAQRLEAGFPGIVGVILKPFDPMTLPAQVSHMIGALPDLPDLPDLATPSDEPVPGELDQALLRLWIAQRPQILEQLFDLAALVDELQEDVVRPDALSESRTLANNLIGLLGSLGLYRSCDLARKIEREIRSVEATQVGAIAETVARLTVELQHELACEVPEPHSG